jgi:DnaK suppressor protein
MNVQAFKKLIMDEIAELDGLSKTSKSGRDPVILDQQSVGRLSRMDAMQQQSMDLAREERRQQRLGILAAALQRIEADDYGYCLRCDEPIKDARLKIDPAVLTCVSCAR